MDTYAFTLDKPGAATLSFAFAPPQGITGSFYVLTLADASHSAIWSGAIDAAESVSPTLYLGAGTYYVQVTVGRNAWPGAYTLSMGFEARADGEAEGNGSMEAAAPIPANTPIHGSFLHSGDVDWFRLVLDAPAVVQLRLQFAPLEENARTYVLTLTDGGQEYLRANVRGQESDFAAVPVCLDAGTYYIQLENPGFIAQEYALTAVCVAAQAVEQEPNDTLAGATPLLAGRAYSGVCASRQDVDTYLLTVAPKPHRHCALPLSPLAAKRQPTRCIWRRMARRSGVRTSPPPAVASPPPYSFRRASTTSPSRRQTGQPPFIPSRLRKRLTAPKAARRWRYTHLKEEHP